MERTHENARFAGARPKLPQKLQPLLPACSGTESPNGFFEDFLIGLFDLGGLVDAEAWTFFQNSASAVSSYLMIIDTNDSHTPPKSAQSAPLERFRSPSFANVLGLA